MADGDLKTIANNLKDLNDLKRGKLMKYGWKNEMIPIKYYEEYQ